MGARSAALVLVARRSIAMASPAPAFLVHVGPLPAPAFLSRLSAEGAALLLGGGGALGAEAVQLVGLAALVWLAVVAWHGVVLHYGVGGERAATIVALALLLFYLVPLALIALAVAAVVIAAVWLGIFSGP